MNFKYLNLLINHLILIHYVCGLLLPIFPNNIICFPERDFCTIENYLEYSNQQLTINVIRDNTIMGSAKGLVSGSDVAFEVNHPGSLCWGDNTDLKVTPDIKIGDKIEIKKDALLLSEIIIKNGYITKKELIDNSLKITGFLDSLINTDNIEIRIVNPDFKNTIVGRRDIRAIYGSLSSNAPGYLSGISVTDNILTAIFEFNDNIIQNMAFTGALSLSMWEFVDISGNRIGITISEFEEVGGPWSLLCPPYAIFSDVGILNDLIIFNDKIRWNKNVNLLPGANAITGFNINILRNINSDINLIHGYRFSNNIDNYDFSNINIMLTDKIEFRIMTDLKMSEPNIIQLNDLLDDILLIMTPQADLNIITYSNKVELKSNTNQIIYTLDNSEPDFNNGFIYTKPIIITNEITIKAISLAYNGKISNIISGRFAPEIIQQIYNPPSNLQVTSISNALLLKWDQINDILLNLFKINIYLSNNLIKSIETTTNSYTVTNLLVGSKYQFTISARYNQIWSPESLKTNEIEFPQLVDMILVSSIRWRISDFRVIGTSSMPNKVLTLYYVNIDNTISSNTINLQGTNTPITAVSSNIADITNNYPFEIRVQRNQVPSNPGRLFIKSSGGGISGPHNI